MNGTSHPVFELTKPLPDLVRVPLRAVAQSFESLGLRYFLVGAAAREIILESVFGRPAGRSTRDLDFGVALSNWEEFETLELLSSKRETLKKPQRHKGFFIATHRK